MRVMSTTSLFTMTARSTVPLGPLPPRSKRNGRSPPSPCLPIDAFSPTRSPSESGKSVSFSRACGRSHLYNACRDLQREDGAVLIDKRFSLQYPVAGRDYIQRNQRVPALKRHVTTNDRWIDLDKWIFCGIAADRTCMGSRVTDEVGVYMFKGQAQ